MAEPLQLGLIVGLTEQVEDAFKQVTDVGLRTCQLCCWKPQIYGAKLAEQVRAASKRTGIEISSLWTGHSGPAEWNFTKGPSTIGVVPAATRAGRVQEYKRAAEFAQAIGAPSITTHVGFVPEDMHHPDYRGTVDALREIGQECQRRGLNFCFETGQETPVTLLRTIEDIGLPNLGVNLDPANLILYGKANPVDALDVFGKRVLDMHAKDGFYPTDGQNLGREVPIGQGKVDFKALIGGLKKLGFKGRVTIEREISGPEQKKDILEAIAYLKPLL
jgi:sugar phosphate isomerase/epimerase